LALSLLAVAACGAHAPRPNTANEVAHGPPVPTLRPATDYFPPATAAIARVDIEELRELSAYAPLWEIAERMAQRESPAEQELFAAFRELEQATDTFTVGSTLRLGPHRNTDFVLVGRGHYELSSLRRWAAVLARKVHQTVSEHAGRPLFTYREVTVYSPDDQTVVWAYGVAPERLLALFDGATRAPGLLDGLLLWAQQRGFGEHTIDASALPGPALVTAFARQIWRQERYLGALDAASVSFDAHTGLQAELHVDTGYPGAAENLMQRLFAMRGDVQEEIASHLPVLSPFMRSLEFRVHEGRLVATAALTQEQLESVLSFGVTMARASVRDDVVVGTESRQLLSADLESICGVISSSPPDSAEAQAELDQRLRSQLRTRGGRVLWRALLNAPADARDSMLQQGAQDLGLPDFACPALDRDP